MKEHTKTVLSLIENQLENGKYKEQLEKTIHMVHILFFLKEQLQEHIKSDFNYIGTEDYHKLISCIDHNTIKLIKEISNL